MTRAEAIKILKSKMDGTVDTSYEWAEAVRMAIAALKNEDAVIDKVLERIDELNNTKALAKATPVGSYLHKTYARRLKGAVMDLKGGEQE